MKLKPETQVFTLDQANEALMALKYEHVRGAKVLKID
jgi:alcohol dehydrogenase, propanol-preferring